VGCCDGETNGAGFCIIDFSPFTNAWRANNGWLDEDLLLVLLGVGESRFLSSDEDELEDKESVDEGEIDEALTGVCWWLWCLRLGWKQLLSDLSFLFDKPVLNWLDDDELDGDKDEDEELIVVVELLLW
jgi:hypothetical protein